MRTVLIADDERTTREGIASAVDWKSLGVSRVLLAADGQEACKLIERNRPEIALVDIVMPEMTGIELIARFCDEEGAPEFVIISGHGEFDYAQEAIRYNVNDYLLKPCDPNEIEASIRRVVSRIEKRRSAVEEQQRLREYVASLLPQAREQIVRDFLTGEPEGGPELFTQAFRPSAHEFKVLLFSTGDPDDQAKLAAVKRCVDQAVGSGEGALWSVSAVVRDSVALILEARRASDDDVARLRAAVAHLGLSGVQLAVSGTASLGELPKRYREAAEAVRLHRLTTGDGGSGSLETIPWIDAETRHYSRPVREVINYVREHLGESSLTLQHIATNVLYLHPDYLGKRFKKECGMKFSDYLMAQRMEKAKSILAASADLKVYEVARQVGLGDHPAYFGQVFRKYTGMLPSEFRAKFGARARTRPDR